MINNTITIYNLLIKIRIINNNSNMTIKRIILVIKIKNYKMKNNNY